MLTIENALIIYDRVKIRKLHNKNILFLSLKTLYSLFNKL
jgi:hypothetical protein